MATSAPEVDPGTAPPRVPPRPRRRWWPALLVLVGVLFVGATGAAVVIRVPYVIISPGDATALDDRVVSISGVATHRPRGAVLYLTVRVTNEDPSVLRYLLARLDDDTEVEKKQNVIGCATYDENDRINRELMTESQDAAKTVALRRLGYHVLEEDARTVIVAVDCDGPSRGSLMLGDRITSIDGTPVTRAEEIRPLVAAHRPGETVKVSVRRGADTVTQTVRAGERDGVAFLGILARTITTARFPFPVTIDTQRVSGPSAGLAFTLAIIDQLTAGDLTGGQRIAVTGSIESDGRVSPVGGVAQKAVAARASGARLMLVPKGEARAARAHAGSMKVVAVADVDAALTALQRAGGTGIPARTTSG
jgi:PDZ domain-containing protein